MEKDKTKPTFTLCDGCVLAGLVILVASIAHPPVTQAMAEQKLVDLADALQAVRSQIRIYRAETGLLPGQQSPDDRSITSEEFVAALTGNSDAFMAEFPANPYVADPAAAVRVTCVSDPLAKPTGAEPTGWWYNAATGQFCACDSQFHTHY